MTLEERVEQIEERLRTLENSVFRGSPSKPQVRSGDYTGPLALPLRQLGRARNLTSITSLPLPSHLESVQVKAKPDKDQWWRMPVM